MNAVGLRDQRISLYERRDDADDDGGYSQAVFYLASTRWGRLDSSNAAISEMQRRLGQKVDAVAEFSDEATIPLNGVAVNVGTNEAWWIRGSYDSRMLRRVHVALDRVTDEQFRGFTLYPPDNFVHGVPVVGIAES